MRTRLHLLLDRLLEVPPIGTWRQRRFDAAFRQGGYGGVCRGVYASHAEAAAAASLGMAMGYDNEAAGKMYKDRLERIYPGDYPMMLWLDRAFEGGARRVFDLGGHVGIAYYAYRRFVHFPGDLSWLVHDVPAVMQAGEALARERDAFGQLAFVDEASATSAAASADVFFTSGCQQYLEQPLAERLRGLPRLPTWVLVNLLPLHETKDFWTVQSIGSSLCPYHIERRSAFLDSMRSLGYAVRDVWENAEKRCEVAFSPQHDLDRYHGMAFHLEPTQAASGPGQASIAGPTRA